MDGPSDEYKQWSVSRESIEDRDIVTIQLEHPQSAITHRALEEMLELFEHLTNDESVGAVVHTGGPDAFCRGMDIAEFATMVTNTDPGSVERRRQIQELTRLFHDTIIGIRNAPQPVIAAVDGTAAGGGLSQVLACDLVYSSDEATFTHSYTDIGTTSDGGSTYFLPRLIGLQRAKELVFSPQPVSADEMAGLGLVNEVVSDGQTPTSVAHERAGEIITRPAFSISKSKQLLNRGIESPLETHLERERELMTEAVQREEFEKRIMQFVESS